MAREVTAGEVRVISDLLAGEPASDARSKYAGLARSTYVVARRRVFQERWVYDRYVPNPALLGYRRVRLQLARPYADRLHELSVQWRNDPGAVLLWQYPGMLFGVFFDHTDHHGEPKGNQARGCPQASTLHVIEGDPKGPWLPVYFDPEGAWHHLVRSGGTVGYPRALGGAVPPSPARERFRRHSAFPHIVRELLARTPSEGLEARPLHLRGTFGLSRSRRRTLELGFVGRRVLVDFGRLPPLGGMKVARLMLLHGELLPNVKVDELFRDLVGSAGVHPFLFAFDRSGVMLGAYGEEGPGRTGTDAPIPGRERPLTVFQRYLRELDLYWVDLRGLDVILDHAYDRLELPRVGSRS